MARYIDADALLNKIPDDLPYKASVKRVLIQAPTADVAPKSEDCLPLDVHEALKQRAVERAKSEVAREIFALIFDRLLSSFPSQSFIDAPCTTHDRLFDMLDELQKKYTEEVK